MNKEQILNAVETLSRSQGFYCSLYERLKEDDDLLTKLSEYKFKDIVDLVLFIEG